eukprot:3748450-Prymnesium_polylepis.1
MRSEPTQERRTRRARAPRQIDPTGAAGRSCPATRCIFAAHDRGRTAGADAEWARTGGGRAVIDLGARPRDRET